MTTESFAELLQQAHGEAEREWLAKVAFVGEYAEEERQEKEEDTMDALDDEEDQLPLPEGIEEALQKEEELLEEMPLPGVPGHEKRRREAWLKIPRRARAAIRKMHK